MTAEQGQVEEVAKQRLETPIRIDVPPGAVATYVDGAWGALSATTGELTVYFFQDVPAPKAEGRMHWIQDEVPPRAETFIEMDPVLSRRVVAILRMSPFTLRGIVAWLNGLVGQLPTTPAGSLERISPGAPQEQKSGG
ncbi:MAG: hypothetical protein IRZ26_01935 [Clostridia bacterium]|nr:hypothetical protein [Clostridia bacterium]